jgi:hypothetical protein
LGIGINLERGLWQAVLFSKLVTMEKADTYLGRAQAADLAAEAAADDQARRLLKAVVETSESER